MRKIISLLCAVLIVCSMSVHAAEIDFSKYTDEELVELRKSIAEELKQRGYPLRESIPTGKYTAGKDIKPGRYYICGNDEGSRGAVYLYADEDTYKNGTWWTMYYPETDEKIVFELEEGQVAYFKGVGGDDAYLEDATLANSFWAP